ncbi:hypothetical protein [Marinicella litoralis]|uniref:Uncharacterized protein n=1 Tax=Marinicella litoralis TaxID=644220 RepID=A0A4R6XYW9_9GAMM|nr:hypothetical protein [Marinicella litoralis]TDR23457.1 hypothetical protein C8D91_0318 [Marinicella litoralis]
MKTKALGLLSLALLLLCLGYPALHAPEPTAAPTRLSPDSIRSVPTTKNSVSSRESIPITAKVDVTTTDTTVSELQQQVLDEINFQLYSDDPFVEIYSMEWTLEMCKTNIFVNELIKHASYQQQQKITQSIQQKCELSHTKYPSLFAINDRKKTNALFEPQSQLGQLIKTSENPHLTAFDRQTVSMQILTQSIKEGNSSVMMLSAMMHSWGGNTIFPITQILKTHDQQYANQISSMAIMLLACQYQQGVTCDSTSALMLLTCAHEPQVCGLDYQTWYLQNTLPGMKKDVAQLMDYYQQFRE